MSLPRAKAAAMTPVAVTVVDPGQERQGQVVGGSSVVFPLRRLARFDGRAKECSSLRAFAQTVRPGRSRERVHGPCR